MPKPLQPDTSPQNVARLSWADWDSRLVAAIKAKRSIRNEIDGMALALRTAFPELAPTEDMR